MEAPNNRLVLTLHPRHASCVRTCRAAGSGQHSRDVGALMENTMKSILAYWLFCLTMPNFVIAADVNLIDIPRKGPWLVYSYAVSNVTHFVLMPMRNTSTTFEEIHADEDIVTTNGTVHLKRGGVAGGSELVQKTFGRVWFVSLGADCKYVTNVPKYVDYPDPNQLMEVLEQKAKLRPLEGWEQDSVRNAPTIGSSVFRTRGTPPAGQEPRRSPKSAHP
jgi:hypothetical protein